MRPNKIEYMSMLSKKESDPSSVSKNEMNAALKKYSEGELGKHKRAMNFHEKYMGREKATGLLNFNGGKRRTKRSTKRHAKKRSTKRHAKKRSTRRHTRRQ